jgi:hypothetical protein
VLFVSIVISMEINRRHYFQSSLLIYPLIMSKRPPGRPLGMKCTKRYGVSLSIKDEITVDKKK